MERKYNKQLLPLAKALRKRMTRQESRLWYDFLRAAPVRFRRQKVLGRYIADFYCAELKLVIELDGSQHYEASGQAADAIRTGYLREYGIKVIRIPNNYIDNNFEGVCVYLQQLLDNPSVAQ